MVSSTLTSFFLGFSISASFEQITDAVIFLVRKVLESMLVDPDHESTLVYGSN